MRLEDVEGNYFQLLGFPHFFSFQMFFNSETSPVFWPRNCISKTSLSQQGMGRFPPEKTQFAALQYYRFRKERLYGVFFSLKGKSNTTLPMKF